MGKGSLDQSLGNGHFGFESGPKGSGVTEHENVGQCFRGPHFEFLEPSGEALEHGRGGCEAHADGSFQNNAEVRYEAIRQNAKENSCDVRAAGAKQHDRLPD